MKKWIYIVLWSLLSVACIREKYDLTACEATVAFQMKDVPYVLVGDEVVNYQPYYKLTERLDLFLFAGEKISVSEHFDYRYCREHPVISLQTFPIPRYALFVANLYHPKELNWYFQEDRLKARFSILDFEEPPILLAAIADWYPTTKIVPVEMRMMVSRLEIGLVNPPNWVSGLNVNIQNIAATVDTDYRLGDTTHIYKYIRIDHQQPGTSWYYINTFPTYRNRAAVLNINFVGPDEVLPLLVEDNRLHLLPGVITRLNIEFDAENKITLSLEVNGKWEIIDEGHIII